MATRTVNLGNLSGLAEELERQLGPKFSIDEQDDYKDDYKTDNKEGNKQGNTESVVAKKSGKSSIQKKVVKKVKEKKEYEESATPDTLIKKVSPTTVSILDNKILDTDKDKLREAIIWAEIIGEPVSKKRRRR